ncbi:MAG: restriction endonuclease subunit S [Zoogloea oleivorans]|jgi:type I restriction enzyme S subunit|uniref:restriction endonuclease subunit S n=1 Tax=Zoogloea oleivorans TaxID=1552750 RepID=UPI002A368E7E|nr:restriction endonuclease subunit S [Zoogloea oleivorans]MDY0035528.1 restriction endonuclease subunit S [Zoogloea oleivorans]
MKYAAYSEYKTSPMTWLDQLPTHWNAASLRWMSKRYAGGTPDKGNEAYWEEGEIPWINSGAVNDGYITQPSELITREGFAKSSAKWIPKDALVMALAGQGKTKGMVAQLGIPTTCNQSMAALIPDHRFAPRYLYYWLTANYQNIRNLAGGEARDGLNLEMLGSIPCPVPPVDEQQTIARFLDAKATQIDALVAQKRQLIDKLKEKRSALIARTVTRGLPPEATNAAGLEPNPEMKDSGVSWLGTIPDHWDIDKFSREVHITEGQVDPEVEPFASMFLIAPNHIESGSGRLLALETAAEQFAESGKYLCPEGAVVYSKIRPALRKVVIAPENCLCSADMYPLTCRNKLTNPYLYWLLLSNQFSAWSVLESDRVAMPKINRETLNELRIPIPPQEEQLEIVEYLAMETAKVDHLLSKADAVISSLTEYRQALITSSVTGKIDVRALA